MPKPLSEASRMLGVRLQAARRDLGLSQEEVAHLARMNVSNFGKIERGLANPTFHTIVRLAGVLNVDPGTLVGGLDAKTLPPPHDTFTARDYIRERDRRRK